VLLDELADAVADGTRKEYMESLATVPLLIIDDFGMRKLPLTAAEDLLEIVMRRYERASTLLTSNRPVEDWGKLLGDTAAVSAMLDRLLHHGHVLKCGPRAGAPDKQRNPNNDNLLKRPRRGHTMACPDRVLIGRFCGDHHWPVLR
jgi:DNA replication protein DnaC